MVCSNRDDPGVTRPQIHTWNFFMSTCLCHCVLTCSKQAPLWSLYSVIVSPFCDVEIAWTQDQALQSGWGQQAGLPSCSFQFAQTHYIPHYIPDTLHPRCSLSMTFVFAAEDCKQLIKLPKVKCLRNSERQGRLCRGAELACHWNMGYTGCVCLGVQGKTE